MLDFASRKPESSWVLCVRRQEATGLPLDCGSGEIPFGSVGPPGSFPETRDGRAAVAKFNFSDLGFLHSSAVYSALELGIAPGGQRTGIEVRSQKGSFCSVLEGPHFLAVCCGKFHVP